MQLGFRLRVRASQCLPLLAPQDWKGLMRAKQQPVQRTHLPSRRAHDVHLALIIDDCHIDKHGLV
jgi:hypothetical protein